MLTLRRRRSDSYDIHRFFCINCGNEGIPLARKTSLNKAAFHRKKLYCPYCQCNVNHVECRTEEEVLQFKKDFNKKIFKEEAIESIESSNKKIILGRG